MNQLITKSNKNDSYDKLKCRCGKVKERNDMTECCYEWWCFRCIHIPNIKDKIICPNCCNKVIRDAKGEGK